MRAARGLIDWRQDDLVEKSGVSKRSIQNIENNINITDRVRRDLYEAFEKAGLEFYNSDKPGVRFKGGD